MALHRFVHHLVAGLVLRLTSRLLFLFVRQRVDALLLGAIGVDDISGGPLCHRNGCDLRSQRRRIRLDLLELFVEEFFATNLTIARTRRRVETERDTVEPIDLTTGDRRGNRGRDGRENETGTEKRGGW